jgi:hypothetical protein
MAVVNELERIKNESESAHLLQWQNNIFAGELRLTLLFMH